MPESYFGNPSNTPEISTGNVATVNDARDTTKPNNGAKNPLGTSYVLSDSSGRLKKVRYVRLNSTVAPTLSSSNTPGPCYWKDNTFTVVTATFSEGITAEANSIAGFILNSSATNGNFIFIQVAGYIADVPVPASTVKGDCQIGASNAAPLLARVAAGTAPTNKVAAWTLTDRASNKSDVLSAVESL